MQMFECLTLDYRLNQTAKIKTQDSISRSQCAADGAFEFEKFALQVKAAAVSTKGAVRGENAVARYDDRNRVTVISHADGAKSVRVPDTACNVRIRASLAVGNGEQGGPAGELKRVPRRSSGNVNVRRLPAKYSSSSRIYALSFVVDSSH